MVTRAKDRHVDPALCLYEGARFICITDNSALCERVPRGNGTMCKFRSIKIKPDATTMRIKMFHGKRVTTINARDVEYMECEVIDNNTYIKTLHSQLTSLSLNPHRGNKKRIKKYNKK